MAPELKNRGRLVCIGFMGAGKSTAARSLAQALGTEAIDVDSVVEQRLGKPIERVFAEDGESTFREAEERITLELLNEAKPAVLALGGGAITHARVRDALHEHTVIWLDVALDVAWTRCRDSNRPLAREREQFEHLYHQREPLYAELADATVPAERSTRMEPVLDALENIPQDTKLLWATSASADYPAYIGNGLLTERRFWPETVTGRRFLVTDGAVGRRYAELLEPHSARIAIMPGEQSKTIAHAEIVWTELVRAGMTRADVVVALGGGVVGDLAGFVAATLFRGIRFVTAPTTLLAQVDSSVGGKTGLNLPEGKNLVGAFHQPSLVVADVLTLKTLADREFRSGLAEVVKHAMIADAALFGVLEREAERVLGRDADVLEAIIAKNCAIKARVVEQDEREAGLRAVLNFGHTVGHAVEAALGYGVVTHGEAVAYGMLAAAALSVRRGLCAQADAQRLEALLRRFDLITTNYPSPELLEKYILRDKKMRDGVLQFVLTLGVGSVSLAPVSDWTDLWEALHGLQA